MKVRRLVGLDKIRMPKLEYQSLRQLVDNRWFALTELIVVLMSAAAWILVPEFGIWLSLIALLPWVLRALAGQLPFRRTPFDWLIAIFLVTAWVGYWAAYDKPAAWIKVWLIVSAVLLYHALSYQPKQNLLFLSFLSFSLALGLSIYFCLTYDFAAIGGKLGSWWTNHRPPVAWPAIHYGYFSGLVLISTLSGAYWLWSTGKKFLGLTPVVMHVILLVGTSIAALLFLLTIPRGLEIFGLGVVGLWLLWRVSILSGSNVRIKAIFPVLVLTYLVVLIAFTYFLPANAAPDLPQTNYGTNSRKEVLARSALLLSDYPVTGAGLASFPGLYSRYVLVIPHLYFTNSYNLFLDVAIEQGALAGLMLGVLYVGGIVRVSRAIVTDPPNELQLIRWAGLCVLLVTIVHGLFYDYLYNGNGSSLLFYPLGMAMTGAVNPSSSGELDLRKRPVVPSWSRTVLGALLAVLVILVLLFDKIVPLWYANLGAIQMSQVQLKDFPTNEWETAEIVPRLEMAETTLQTALRYEPQNQTANYRLGLISMLRQDFQTAAAKLDMAYEQAPSHRGIIKSLGYCYVWLGDMDKAQPLLDHIPEAQDEMKVYIWWWGTQGRPDLSENASRMVARLD